MIHAEMEGSACRAWFMLSLSRQLQLQLQLYGVVRYRYLVIITGSASRGGGIRLTRYKVLQWLCTLAHLTTDGTISLSVLRTIGWSVVSGQGSRPTGLGPVSQVHTLVILLLNCSPLPEWLIVPTFNHSNLSSQPPASNLHESRPRLPARSKSNTAETRFQEMKRL